MPRTINGTLTVEEGEVISREGTALSIGSDGGSFLNLGRLEAIGENAYALYVTEWVGPIENRGQIIVQYAGLGTGIGFEISSRDMTNSGSITVSADNAYGYRSDAPGSLHNSGDIIATGGLSAIAVYNARGSEFSNSGTISARAADTATAIILTADDGHRFSNDGTIYAEATDSLSQGLVIRPGDWPGFVYFTNNGTIEADVAIVSQDGPDGPVIDDIVNTGTIIGSIYLGHGGDQFVNEGHLSGSIYAGEGNDLVDTRSSLSMSGGVFLGDGNDLAFLSAAGQAAWGGTGDDRLIGEAGNDRLYGEDGDDILDGWGGDDILDGGAGADSMAGGRGNDRYYVDNRNDQLFEAADAGHDKVFSSVSFTLGDNIEDMSLTGSADAKMVGNSLSNTLNGNRGDNNIAGGAGADRMSGGRGHDNYWVDDIGDRVIEFAGEGTDRVYSTVSFTLGANVEKLTLKGEAWINGTGNELNNTMSGNMGRNVLTGGLGADTLTGKAGSDTFVWRSIEESKAERPDVVTDLNDWSDKIDFRQIDGDVNTAGVQGFEVVDAFSGQAGELVLSYDAGTNITALTVDVNGDGVADMLIQLVGNHETFDRFLFAGG